MRLVAVFNQPTRYHQPMQTPFMSSTPVRIGVERIRASARMPDRQHDTDAGFDLAYAGKEDVTIQPGETRLLDTGLRLNIPDGWEVQIRPRSGLASDGVTIPNSPGTVDAGYRGEVKVLLRNESASPVLVKTGHRIAQAVVKRVPVVAFHEVESVDPETTNRGEGGFGSTDQK